MKDKAAGIDLKAGCQTLKGPQALGFVRTRHAFASQDLQRVQNQRKFLAALTSQGDEPRHAAQPVPHRAVRAPLHRRLLRGQGDHLYNLAGFAWAMRGLTKGDGLTTTVPLGGNGYSPSVGAYITWDSTGAGALFRALREDQPVPQELAPHRLTDGGARRRIAVVGGRFRILCRS